MKTLRSNVFLLQNQYFHSKMLWNYWRYCFLGLPRVFFQGTAPKLVQTLTFWVYWAKKRVASSVRFGDLFSYSLTRDTETCLWERYFSFQLWLSKVFTWVFALIRCYFKCGRTGMQTGRRISCPSWDLIFGLLCLFGFGVWFDVVAVMVVVWGGRQTQGGADTWKFKTRDKLGWTENRKSRQSWNQIFMQTDK